MNGNYYIDELIKEFLNKEENKSESKAEKKEFINLNDVSIEDKEADIEKDNELEEEKKEDSNYSDLFSKIIGGYILFIELYQFIN